VILLIVATGIAMVIVFLVGFWAGRLTERASWKRDARKLREHQASLIGETE